MPSCLDIVPSITGNILLFIFLPEMNKWCVSTMYIFFVFEKAQQSELSAQFHCELKTTLKNKVHLKEKKKQKKT